MRSMPPLKTPNALTVAETHEIEEASLKSIVSEVFDFFEAAEAINGVAISVIRAERKTEFFITDLSGLVFLKALEFFRTKLIVRVSIIKDIRPNQLR